MTKKRTGSIRVLGVETGATRTVARMEEFTDGESRGGRYSRELKLGPANLRSLDDQLRAKIRARCIAYKSALRVFLDQITPSDLEKISYKIEDWKTGGIASCLEEGGFLPPVTTGDLQVFTAEKKPLPLDRAAADALLGAIGVEAEEEADAALEPED